jgi:hypothetical protein
MDVTRGNAKHIATFDPPTVLALLDRLAAAEAKVARVEALIEAVPTCSTHGVRREYECDECLVASEIAVYDRELEAALNAKADQ